MGKLKEFFQTTKKYLFVIFVSIIFYEILENFGVVRSSVKVLQGVLTPIFLGIFFAYIVNLPASLIYNAFFRKKSAKVRNLGRTFSIILSFILILGLIALLFWIVIPKVAESVGLLFDDFDSYFNGVVDWAVDFWESLNLNVETTARAVEISEDLLGKLEGFIMGIVPKLLNYTFDAVGIVADMLLALAFSIYVLLDKEKLLAHARRFVRALFSEQNSEKLLETCTLANKTFRSYIAGQLTSCLIIGVLCYIGMRILSMPFPEMISVFVAVFALMPILGPWISTIPSAFIILMASPDNPMLAVWFVVMVVVIQQIDNNFIYPRVVGDAVGLSSAWVLAAIIIGGGLFGFTGLIFAVPTTAVIYRLIGDWTNAKAKEKGVPIVESVPEAGYDLRGRKHKIKSKRKTKKIENEKSSD